MREHLKIIVFRRTAIEYRKKLSVYSMTCLHLFHLAPSVAWLNYADNASLVTGLARDSVF